MGKKISNHRLQYVQQSLHMWMEKDEVTVICKLLFCIRFTVSSSFTGKYRWQKTNCEPFEAYLDRVNSELVH